VTEHGHPRRTAVLCYAQAAVFLFENGMPKLGEMALKLAFECDAAANSKANERNLPAVTPPSIRHQLRRAQAWSELYKNNILKANELALDSVNVAKNETDMINGWMCVAKCASRLDASLSSEESLVAYGQAIDIAKKSELTKIVPLSGYIEIGKLLMSQGKFLEALNMMLVGCSLFISSSLFYLVGVCCLRLDRLVDAEDALQEANILNNRNAEIWAYLSIMCLQSGNTSHARS
jgi:tetratricopeptide (TPR) repeat protein